MKMKIRREAKKALDRMPKKMADRFYAAFDLIEASQTNTLDIKKLQGSEGYRLRIGDYRAIFTHDFELIVIRVGARGDVYK